jgi:hypothetical protein
MKRKLLLFSYKASLLPESPPTLHPHRARRGGHPCHKRSFLFFFVMWWTFQNAITLLLLLLLLLLLFLLFITIDFSLGGSSPYTSIDNTNKNKIYITETIQKHSTNNTKHCKYKCT